MAAPAVTLRRKRFLFGAAFLTALAEPAGAVLGLLAVRVDPGLNPLFMGFAAGAMMPSTSCYPWRTDTGTCSYSPLVQLLAESPTWACHSPSRLERR